MTPMKRDVRVVMPDADSANRIEISEKQIDVFVTPDPPPDPGEPCCFGIVVSHETMRLCEISRQRPTSMTFLALPLAPKKIVLHVADRPGDRTPPRPDECGKVQ
jgi:hypothetical protein